MVCLHWECACRPSWQQKEMCDCAVMKRGSAEENHKVITHSVTLISLVKIISALINTVSVDLSFPVSATWNKSVKGRIRKLLIMSSSSYRRLFRERTYKICISRKSFEKVVEIISMERVKNWSFVFLMLHLANILDWFRSGAHRENVLLSLTAEIINKDLSVFWSTRFWSFKKNLKNKTKAGSNADVVSVCHLPWWRSRKTTA